MTIYVVLSRDTNFLFCTTDKAKAEEAQKKQINEEEFAGGRPSVYIQETILN